MEKPCDGPRLLALRHSQSASVPVGKTHVAVLIIRTFFAALETSVAFQLDFSIRCDEVFRFQFDYSITVNNQSYSPLWPPKKTPRENLEMSKKSEGNKGSVKVGVTDAVVLKGFDASMLVFVLQWPCRAGVSSRHEPRRFPRGAAGYLPLCVTARWKLVAKQEADCDTFCLHKAPLEPRHVCFFTVAPSGYVLMSTKSKFSWPRDPFLFCFFSSHRNYSWHLYK